MALIDPRIERNTAQIRTQVGYKRVNSLVYFPYEGFYAIARVDAIGRRDRGEDLHGPVLPGQLSKHKLGSLFSVCWGKTTPSSRSQHYLYQGEDLSKVSFNRVLFFASGFQIPQLNTSRPNSTRRRVAIS